MTESKIIDLDRVAELVRRAGRPAFVGMMGGSTAAVIAGDYDGEFGQCVLGLGWFESRTGNTYRDARGALDELMISPDTLADLEDGEIYYAKPSDDEQSLADEMVRRLIADDQLRDVSPEQSEDEAELTEW